MNKIFSYFKNKPDLQVINHRYTGAEAQHFEVVDLSSGIRGFGADPDPSLAQTKALFEMIERTLYSYYAEQREVPELYQTSSGWAAHRTKPQAKQASLFELIERDAVIYSWLTKNPPAILGKVFFPMYSASFQLLEFGRGSNFLTLGVVLERIECSSRMLISATTESRTEGIAKLLVDSERAFELMASQDFLCGSIMQENYLALCQAEPSEIAWLFQGGTSLKYSGLKPTYETFKVPLWDGSEAFVSRARCPQLQELFYQTEGIDYVNSPRFSKFARTESNLNQMAHPIL